MVISCACTISRSNSRARCPTSPPNTGNRYFVIHTILLAVPDRVTSGLRILHTRSVASQSPKGEGFTDPKGGTLNTLPRFERVMRGVPNNFATGSQEAGRNARQPSLQAGSLRRHDVSLGDLLRQPAHHLPAVELAADAGQEHRRLAEDGLDRPACSRSTAQSARSRSAG